MEDKNRLRFTGIRALYGESGFEKLQQAHVLLAGTGGVGSWAAEALVRSGVGHLTLVDPDEIDIKNSNRQLHTLDTTIGLKKAEVLAGRLKLINPEVKIEVKLSWLTPENLEQVLSPCPHHAIDAIDDIDAKCALINFLCRQQAVFVVSGGAGARIEPSKLHLGDLSEAKGDGLIKHVRDVLRREYNFPKGGKKMGIMCSYSEEQPIYAPDNDPSLPRFGASMPVTASAGLLMAGYLITKIAAA